MTVFYSLGLAAWHEREHLIDRFGDAWMTYRREVRAWRLRAKVGDRKRWYQLPEEVAGGP